MNTIWIIISRQATIACSAHRCTDETNEPAVHRPDVLQFANSRTLWPPTAVVLNTGRSPQDNTGALEKQDGKLLFMITQGLDLREEAQRSS